MIHFGSISIWGLVATVVLTTLMEGARGFHLSRMSLPFLLGTAFTGNRDRALVVGAGVHLLAGWMFALLYALVLESLGRTGWWIGTLLGALHGAFVLSVVVPLLPSVHPRLASERHGPTPTRQLEPPGFFGLNYGKRSALVTLVAHLAYGAILGAFYRLAGS